LQVKSQEYFPACSAANLICGGIITFVDLASDIFVYLEYAL